ncbi:unnamed protein product [Owenia fusiformis]|uniref:Cathepsin L1-like n=1 Tax=Owenia fusiformis TaxID=6347 RepID=A0A8S4PBA8_OWEFU|nr:unnamed protein product [Owenia fusiformis]
MLKRGKVEPQIEEFAKIMLRLAVVAMCVTATLGLGSELSDAWKTFKLHHGKMYTKEEETKRRMIWESNIELIQQHNLEADMGKHTYWLGSNEFADMTFAEFKQKMLGTLMSKNSTFDNELLYTPEFKAASEVDWRKRGYVTPVKNQGHCGSCWAFSVTGAIEGQHFRKTGKLVSLSEQNLVDCSKKNHGCDGGWQYKAFDYVKINGIDTEEAYPYIGKDSTCKFDKSAVGATIRDYKSFSGEQNLMTAVAAIGPISCAVDVTKKFQFYKNGIFVDYTCSASSPNHAILVVGYGTDASLYDPSDYWIVKNSWGNSWGEGGYIRMKRNYRNMCGIASNPYYPVV